MNQNLRKILDIVNIPHEYFIIKNDRNIKYTLNCLETMPEFRRNTWVVRWYITILKSHKHEWQNRAINKYENEMYMVCLRCGKAQQRVNKALKPDKFEECERKPEFDKLYDKNGVRY